MSAEDRSPSPSGSASGEVVDNVVGDILKEEDHLPDEIVEYLEDEGGSKRSVEEEIPKDTPKHETRKRRRRRSPSRRKKSSGRNKEKSVEHKSVSEEDAKSSTRSPPRAKKNSKRFFVIKSNCHTDVKVSQQHGMWATQAHNEVKFDEAYEKSDVYFFFSVNESRHFQGYAKMTSGVTAKTSNLWNRSRGGRGWGKTFNVQWMRALDLPFKSTHHLRNPLNMNQPVKVSRDGQEVAPSVGLKLMQLFHRDDQTNGLDAETSAFPRGKRVHSDSEEEEDGAPKKRRRVEKAQKADRGSRSGRSDRAGRPRERSRRDRGGRESDRDRGSGGGSRYRDRGSGGDRYRDRDRDRDRGGDRGSDRDYAALLNDPNLLRMTYDEYCAAHMNAYAQAGVPYGRPFARGWPGAPSVYPSFPPAEYYTYPQPLPHMPGFAGNSAPSAGRRSFRR